MDTSVLLFGAGITLAILELVAGGVSGFDLLLVGFALMLGGAVGLLTGNDQLGLAVAIGLTIVYFLVLRKIVKKRLSIDKEGSNVDAVLNKEGIVEKEIKKEQAGQVKIGAEVWRAESDNGIDTLKKGETIKVVSVSGVTLKVVKHS